jgi:hypothetical protein
MAKKSYVIVLAAQYNNSTNVLFMMEPADVVFRNETLGYDNYQTLEPVASHSHKEQLATTVSGKPYKLFRDHSVKEIK